MCVCMYVCGIIIFVVNLIPEESWDTEDWSIKFSIAITGIIDTFKYIKIENSYFIL